MGDVDGTRRSLLKASLGGAAVAAFAGLSSVPSVSASSSGTLTKGVVILTPTPVSVIIWQAPFPCKVTAFKGYQDVGSGSVVTVYVSSPSLSSFPAVMAYEASKNQLRITAPAVWQSRTSFVVSMLKAGDSLGVQVVSVAGSPSYLSVQVELEPT